MIFKDSDYEEVMDYINTFEEADSMLLEFLNESKPAIKVISENKETAYDYDSFIDIIDSFGFEGLE